MSKQDYYETLEVAKGATVEEIKKSYRRLAMKYHPDRNQGNAEAEAKFKEINEAYEILKDDQKRAAYDRYGHAAFEQGGGDNPFDCNFGSGFGSIHSTSFTIRRKRLPKSTTVAVQPVPTLEVKTRRAVWLLRIPIPRKCTSRRGLLAAISGQISNMCD